MQRAAVVLLGLAAVFAVLTVLAAVRGQVTRADDESRRVAEEFGVPGGTAWRWVPPLAAGSGMALALNERRRKPCILYHGAGYGGGMCFVAGWAVEATFLPAVNGTLVVGVAIPETATVRFGRGRDALRVPAVDVPGRAAQRYFAAVIPTDGSSRLRPNDIAALDAQGRLLGRQHWNDGHGRFGAYDGLYDRKLK